MARKKNDCSSNTIRVSLNQAIELIKHYSTLDRKGPALDEAKKYNIFRLKLTDPVSRGNGSLVWGRSHNRYSVGCIPIVNATSFVGYVH